MVKVIVLLPRRADMSPEAFKQHLRETHLPLASIHRYSPAGSPERAWSGLAACRGLSGQLVAALTRPRAVTRCCWGTCGRGGNGSTCRAACWVM
jgi:hypothetical protein